MNLCCQNLSQLTIHGRLATRDALALGAIGEKEASTASLHHRAAGNRKHAVGLLAKRAAVAHVHSPEVGGSRKDGNHNLHVDGGGKGKKLTANHSQALGSETIPSSIASSSNHGLFVGGGIGDEAKYR